MASRDHSLAIALCASLVVHAATLDYVIRFGVPLSFASSRILHPTTRPQPDDTLIFGLPDATGDAANASPGDLPAATPKNDHAQAALSRDPAGPGRIGNEPSMSILPRMARDASASLLQQSPAHPQFAFGPSSPSESDEAALPRVPRRPIPHHASDSTTPASVAHPSSPPQTPPSNQTASSAASTTPPADPAPMSDSESDPFTSRVAIDFRTGRVDAHLGRKVTTVRPILTLSDHYDLMSMVSPHIRARLYINPDGSVRKAAILESSGSPSVDEAVRIALYQWIFGPRAAGKIGADVMEFGIGWE